MYLLIFLLNPGLLMATPDDIATPFFDSITGLPGGVMCKDNSRCYSKFCYQEGYCAPDGPVEGTTTGGSICTANSDCFSNYCFENVCAPDSPFKGKVAAGGACSQHEQCYSGYCNLRLCGPDADEPGKLAAGSECEFNAQCFAGICHCFLGSCSSKRCGPDGAVEGKASGGGYCRFPNQCTSGYCYAGRCTPESWREMGKTLDGGACVNDTQCEKGSTCYLQMCSPKTRDNMEEDEPIRNVYTHSSRTDEDTAKPKKPPAGAQCTRSAECSTGVCIFNRCAPVSRFDPSKVADGAQCDERFQDGRCLSGHCKDHICTVTHPGYTSFPVAAAGSPCLVHELCYSGLCSNSKCSADSATSPATARLSVHRNRNQVAAGGICAENDDCYSGYCDNKRCGADGPERGTLASGARCQGDQQCYSRYCYKNRCAPSAGDDQEGKVAAGGRCLSTESCPEGCSCVNEHCHLEKVVNADHVQELLRPTFASVPLHGTCWHNAQCKAGKCLERRCTVRKTWRDRDGISGAKKRSFSLLLSVLMVWNLATPIW